MQPMSQPDRCDGSDMPAVRDHAIEPGPEPASRWRESGSEHVCERARALAEFTRHYDHDAGGAYDHHLSKIAGAWSDIFHRPITIREVTEALAALEILRADH